MREIDLITVLSVIPSMASLTIHPVFHLLYMLSSYTLDWL